MQGTIYKALQKLWPFTYDIIYPWFHVILKVFYPFANTCNSYTRLAMFDPSALVSILFRLILSIICCCLFVLFYGILDCTKCILLRTKRKQQTKDISRSLLQCILIACIQDSLKYITKDQETTRDCQHC